MCINKTQLHWVLIPVTLTLLGGCANPFKTKDAKQASAESQLSRPLSGQAPGADDTPSEAEHEPDGSEGADADDDHKADPGNGHEAAAGGKKGGKPVSAARKQEKAKIFPGSGVFIQSVASAPVAADGGAKPDPKDETMLNFDGADLREVVKAIVGDLLNASYTIDPRVQGQINLHTSNPLHRKDLLPTLATLLRMNGAAILLEDGIYKIVPAATAARGSVTPQLGGDTLALPNGSGYGVQITPLKFIAAKEMLKLLEPFASEAGAVRIDEARNLIILSGTERELRHLQSTITMFDVDWLAGMSIGLFSLQSVEVKTAVADLDKIFGAKALSPLAGVVKLVPIERLNAILVITQQAKYLEQAKTWIERLDHSGGAGGGMRLFVYPVQNGMAEKMAILLNGVFNRTPVPTGGKGGASLAPGMAMGSLQSTSTQTTSSTFTSSFGVAPAPGQPQGAGGNLPLGEESADQQGLAGDSVAVRGEVRILADKDNNALLILCSAANYEKLETAIRKLDIQPRQVLIDVTIAEVTLAGDLKYGLEWAFTNGGGNGKLDMGAAGLAALTPGFSYLWSNSSVPGGVSATLNMLANDSRVKVISSPHIMVTDNQQARIQVGDRVPITSQSQSVLGSATGLIASIQYIDTGVLLTVTPRINSGGQVTMDIDQEVSQASITTTSSINSPTISKRALKTTVVVKSGETMVLGGLITDNKTEASSGLPFLSRIPVLGGLFGVQNQQSNRTELILMITPKTISNPQQAQEITNELRSKMAGLGDVLGDLGKLGSQLKKPASVSEMLQKVVPPAPETQKK